MTPRVTPYAGWAATGSSVGPVHALVLDLWARHRPATLLVTHDVDEAVALADRVLVLAGGRIVLDLPNDAARPRRRDTASFAAMRGRLLDRLGVREHAA